MDNQEDKLIGMREVKEMLGVHKNTVYKLLQRGVLKSVKIGYHHRFRKKDILNFMEGKERR